ncbi:MAG: helix-turn-helix domain-containing protein [Castellaniella sp.]|uniref:helix-turn-helix domain-containing protein n=1 Tax=Castellaniella sp. TaxID=1955812 RepID=UPI003C75B082
MSIAVMARVWADYPGGGGSELLTLLALADWSDDAGRCWPSVAAIAGKARLSRSQTQRVVHGLIEGGFLRITGNETGGKPGSTRQYQINLAALTGRMDATPTGRTGATGRVDATGSTHAQEGSHGCAKTGSTHATQTTIEPSRTTNTREQAPAPSPSPAKKKSETTTLKTFLEACNASGEKTIPDEDPIFDYADQVGIDLEMLEVAWGEFKARYLPTAKRQKDWRAHFRNAVRRNWYGLWFLKAGDPARWTTAGEQARRAAA